MSQFNRAAPVRTHGHRSSPLSPPTAVVAFVVAFAGTLSLALIQAPKPFYYDSGSYWSLGDTFIHHGDFSLTNFDSRLRGYILPLLYRGLRAVAQDLNWTSSATAKLFNALLLALIGVVLAPRLAEVTWPERSWSMKRRLLLLTLLLSFWSGYLNYPLSDIPGLAVALLAILAMSRPCSAWSMLAAGGAIAVAIDMRPSYILLIPALPVLAALDLRSRPAARVRRATRLASLTARGRRAARLAIHLGLAATSFALVSLPQSLAAHRHFGTYSFLPGSPDNLEAVQLTEGLRLQLYGTYVGPAHQPQMDYLDESGGALLREQPHRQIVGSRQYIELTIDHPLSLAGVFSRHILNGLDVRYSTPYTSHVSTDWWLRLGGFLLVFAALLRVLWPSARRDLGRTLWRYPVVLLACCLTAVPSAVETRYLLPAFLLSYIIVLAPGWSNPLTGGEGGAAARNRTAAIVLLAGAIFAAVVWHVVSATTDSLRML